MNRSTPLISATLPLNRVLSRGWMFVMLVLALLMAGCGPSPEAETDLAEEDVVELEDLNIALVGNDQTLADAIKRQWSARRDGNANVQLLSMAEFTDAGYAVPAGIDVILFPPYLLGELVSGEQLMEVPENLLADTESLNRKEMLRHARTTLCRFGGRTWCVPLSLPNFSMMFRADVLEAIGEKVPADWESFNRVSRKLNEAGELKDQDGKTLPRNIVMPLSDGWASNMLTVRAAAEARSQGKISTFFSRKTADPQIATPPFVEALEKMKAYAGDDASAQLNFGPAECYGEILEGRAAIAFTWPSLSFEGSELDQSIADQIEIARIPGSGRWYDVSADKWKERDSEASNFVPVIGFEGLVAAIPKDGASQLTAFEFLKWLPGKNISIQLFGNSTVGGPFRSSHLGNPGQWMGDALRPEVTERFANNIREIHEESIYVQFPRIPGRARYVAALDEAVKSCVTGQSDAQTALEAAVKRWNVITNDVGTRKQEVWLRKHHDF